MLRSILILLQPKTQIHGYHTHIILTFADWGGGKVQAEHLLLFFYAP